MNSKRRFINVSYTMSYEKYEEGFTMPEFHFHNDYEIYILEHGERIVSIDGEELVTRMGDAVLFAGGVPHKSRGTGGFSGICIHFSDIYLKKYFTAAAINRLKAVFEVKIINVGTEKLDILKKMTDGFVIDDEDNFLKLAKVFEMLTAGVNVKQSEVRKETVRQSKSRAEEILKYVDENYAYIKNVEELSEKFEVSESYLFRIFKQKYNMTLKNYINSLRIKNICRRLRYSEGTIKSLAVEYGFESYEHFCRVFKSFCGCTPTEYRKQFCKSV